jgi:hypothetical protein
VTKRSGVYGAILAEVDATVVLEMDSNGQLIQVTSEFWFDIVLS